MFRMITVLIVTAVIVWSTCDAMGAQPRQRRLLRRTPLSAAPVATQRDYQRNEPQNPPAYWSMTPELYPQWYGGFHGRMIQNYGYPSGSMGVRGTAW